MNFEYPRNVRFRCKRCARCCGDTEVKARNILLLDLEAEHISNKTMKSVSEFSDKLEGSDLYVYRMKKTGDGKCMFLDGNVCSIYRIRPLVCRFYPFELRADATSGHIFSYTDECPSIGSGLRLQKRFFESLFERSKALIGKTRTDST